MTAKKRIPILEMDISSYFFRTRIAAFMNDEIELEFLAFPDMPIHGKAL